MGFRANLLKKMELDRISAGVNHSMGPPGSGRRIDKPAARRLLESAGLRVFKRRDLELYIAVDDTPETARRVWVLDNDLPLYRTDVEDVVLRKSPLVKEMLSIGNIRRILNDKDVVVSKKDASVETLRKAAIEALNFSFTRADIEEIGLDGIGSLESRYAEGVCECLELFGQMLGYVRAPSGLRIDHQRILGAVKARSDGERQLGPAVLYDLMHNRLRLVLEPAGERSRDEIRRFQRIAGGQVQPEREGAAVFRWLQAAVLEADPQGVQERLAAGE